MREHTASPKSSATRHTRRYVADAAAGLGLFILLTVMVAGTSTFAGTLAFTDPENMNIAMANASGSEHSIVVLGIVFAVLFAFNAAFFRHLGRAYIGVSRVNSTGKPRLRDSVE